MSIETFSANNFRNLSNLELKLIPRFNLFYGLNGAGKSNILESIYFLGSGKSFRTHLLRRLLTYNQDSLQLYSSVLADDPPRKVPLGVERSLHGVNQLRLAGEGVKSHSEIARFLPMQMISQSSYELLVAGSVVRRRFLDWGVFHVERNFGSVWQKLNRIVQQRNSAIKNHVPVNQVTLWNRDLIDTSLQLNSWRKEYLQNLLPILDEMLQVFLPEIEFSISFHEGWARDLSLEEALTAGLEQDLRYGYTRSGAHRADILIRNKQNSGVNAADTLSRGQQKLLVLALKLGQGELLRTATDRNCIFLIDDLPAELDDTKKALVFEILHKLGAQTFITSVDKEHFSFLKQLVKPEEINSFHVKQGVVVDKV